MSIETPDEEIGRLRLERNQFHAALRRQRTAIIEQCAKIAENHGAVGDSIAADIRALKNPPPTNPTLKDLVSGITPENRHGEGEF